MNLANKKFTNNKTGETIKVIDSFENIAILESKQKLNVNDLLNPALFTEEIDPNSFFQNQGSYNILAEKIKNIPPEYIKDVDDYDISSKIDGFNPSINDSAIIMTTEEEEKAELARKYEVNLDTNSLKKQNEAFAKILGDDEDLPVMINKDSISENEEIQRIEVNRDSNEIIVNTPQASKNYQSQPKVQEDPIITMFKKTKRSVNFKMNIEVIDKIPRLDFIEMMEDSYETSIIDYLADEFTDKILQDPSFIRNSIKDRIKHIVYGGEVSKVNDQITDSVTQVEKHESLTWEKEPVLSKELTKKTTRKPRAKKETTEK
jgi:hypothetical protein